MSMLFKYLYIGLVYTTKKSRPIDAAAKAHQACVVGLSSTVLVHPYEMVPYTPAAVVAIARHVNAGGFVKK